MTRVSLNEQAIILQEIQIKATKHKNLQATSIWFINRWFRCKLEVAKIGHSIRGAIVMCENVLSIVCTFLDGIRVQ